MVSCSTSPSDHCPLALCIDLFSSQQLLAVSEIQLAIKGPPSPPTKITFFSSVARSKGKKQTSLGKNINAEVLVSQHPLLYLGDNNFLQLLIVILRMQLS